jgi:hypothetical protein
MFVQFDDGRRRLIARGGPSQESAGFVGGLLDGSNRVAAGVSPAALNKDYSGGGRVLARTFVPNVTAEEAASAARSHARGVNHGANAYGWNANSNSFAADVAEPILGRRPGDARTPGYRTRLREGGLAPPRVDLSPLLRPVGF